jgi:hypothetical protein
MNSLQHEKMKPKIAKVGLESTKFLAPGEPDGEHDPDDEADEEPWPDNPVLGAQELRRFSRVRQLLQE